MSQYRRGADFERRVRHALEADGYEVIRSAGSKGSIDLLAFKKDQMLFIQVKRTINTLLPAQRLELLRIAGLWPNAIALLAYKPKPRQPIAYQRLTGPGPKDWQPWTPDEVVQ